MTLEDAPCPFCTMIGSGRILIGQPLAFAIEDGYPVSLGHSLVLPRRHESDYLALSRDEQIAIADIVQQVTDILKIRYSPAGFNLGVNIGLAAGQTVDHAHLHVIPRYDGDADDPRGGVRWVVPGRANYW